MAVKNLQEILDLGLTAVELGENVAGGVNFATLGKLIETGKKVKPAIDDAKLAITEYANMTDEEAVGLEAWASKEFDLKDDEVESKIELGLAVALKIHELLGLILPNGVVPVPAEVK